MQADVARDVCGVEWMGRDVERRVSHENKMEHEYAGSAAEAANADDLGSGVESGLICKPGKTCSNGMHDTTMERRGGG